MKLRSRLCGGRPSRLVAEAALITQATIVRVARFSCRDKTHLSIRHCVWLTAEKDFCPDSLDSSDSPKIRALSLGTALGREVFCRRPPATRRFHCREKHHVGATWSLVSGSP